MSTTPEEREALRGLQEALKDAQKRLDNLERRLYASAGARAIWEADMAAEIYYSEMEADRAAAA